MPVSGSFTIYHLKTRTFWSQVSTIWEWFVAMFADDSLARKGHTRPVMVYEVINGQWGSGVEQLGRLVLEPALLEFSAYTIDRTNQQHVLNGQPVGWCQRMPLWESLAAINAATAENRMSGERR